MGGAIRREVSAGMETGTIVEDILLNGSSRIRTLEHADYRTAAAKLEKEACLREGVIPVLAGRMPEINHAVSLIRSKLLGMKIDFCGRTQVKYEWEADGCPCAGTVDHEIDGNGCITIYDLKVVDNAAQGLEWKIVDYGYDIQQAAYTEAVQRTRPELEGRVTFRFVFAEIKPSPDVRVVELDGTMEHLGFSRWGRAKAIWRACLAADVWPGYPTDTLRIGAHPKQLADELEAGGEVEL